jgi:hypothetical protein
MADKFLKGSREYHLVEDGKTETKCGHDFSDLSGALEVTKDIAAWPTCALCTAGIPADIKRKLKQGR